MIRRETLQMNHFDQNISISIDNSITVFHFTIPKMS